ncbi:MAG: DNA-3-methyladenine glycosylase I [Pseudomonadota bacterium]
MRDFDDILAIAAERKGGYRIVLDAIDPPKPDSDLATIPDDRWLSMMTKCVFRAGFNWKVIERKWPGFETAFDGFSIGRCAMMDDMWFDELITDTRIVRNPQKVQTVQQNAVFIGERSAEAGGFGKFVADWPASDFIGLVQILRAEGSRLGGTTGQYFLRNMGKDSFVLTRDVVGRLIAEGVIDKPPTSKRALADVQAAFNTWRDQSGQSFNIISRVLAQSVG